MWPRRERHSLGRRDDDSQRIDPGLPHAGTAFRADPTASENGDPSRAASFAFDGFLQVKINILFES